MRVIHISVVGVKLQPDTNKLTISTGSGREFYVTISKMWTPSRLELTLAPALTAPG